MLYGTGNDESYVPQYIEKVAAHVIDAAYITHTEHGSGLTEKTYEFCLYNDLNDMGFFVKSQVKLPISHFGHVVNGAYRLDLLVNDCLVVEVKAIEGPIQPIHKSQIYSYLKAGGFYLGLILNFNTKSLKDGIKRVVNWSLVQ